MKIKPILLLDFDFTLCDSSTRENTHTKNDALDLAAYVNDTAQHDKGLPLLRYILRNKQALQYKYNIIVLTNRDFNRDCKSKIVHLVKTNFICLHRGEWFNIFGDNFKAIILGHFCLNNGVVFIDDDKQYLDIAKKYNARAVCARDLWHYRPHDFTELLLG